MNTEAQMTENRPNQLNQVVIVQGNKLLETVKDILAAGKINRLIISSVNGSTLLDVPYAAGLTVVALVTLLKPLLALLTPVVLLLGQFRIEVIRPEAETTSTEAVKIEVELEPVTDQVPQPDQQ